MDRSQKLLVAATQVGPGAPINPTGRRHNTSAVRLALIEMSRYGRNVIWANKDGAFNCSLGPDGDLILTPVKPRCEITQVWLDEAPR